MAKLEWDWDPWERLARTNGKLQNDHSRFWQWMGTPHENMKYDFKRREYVTDPSADALTKVWLHDQSDQLCMVRDLPGNITGMGLSAAQLDRFAFQHRYRRSDALYNDHQSNRGLDLRVLIWMENIRPTVLY